MSDFTSHAYDTESDEAPTRPGQLSPNGHWIFGSVFAGLIVAGLAFGVWVGAAKKPVETVEKLKDTEKPNPQQQPQQKPPVTPPVSDPPKNDPPKPEPENPKKDPPKTEPPKKDPPQPEPPKPKDPPPVVAVKSVAYKEVAPIIRTYCGNCHGDAGKAKGGVDLKSYAIIMKGDENGKPLVVPGKPEKSPLYESITAGRMPDGGKPGPPPKELQLLHDWIASGAKPRRTILNRGPRRGSARSRVELTPEPPGG